jgi:hypothetical protein
MAEAIIQKKKIIIVKDLIVQELWSHMNNILIKNPII